MAFPSFSPSKFSSSQGSRAGNTPPKKRSWKKWGIGILLLGAFVGGVLFWKANAILGRIAPKGNILSNIVKSLPGVENTLAGEKEGRINVALLGMRGKGVEGGGLLADTIMILSFHPQGKGEGDRPKAALVSIPRDLYVTVPGTSDKQKINAVHFYGEEKGAGQGLAAMKTILTDVTGVPIHYVASIDFKGFEELIDAVGGVSITLDAPFTEPMQFRESHVCDANVFTVPTTPLQYEHKYVTTKSGRRRIVKSYPLCYNKDVECGGVFNLPAGTSVLNGEKALCFARARVTSNDFERAKRQHMILEALRAKLLSLGTLSDFSKVNAILGSLGDNARTDMEGWEMKRFFDLYLENKDVKISQDFVIDNSENGLLYAPENTGAAGYILLPKGNNYDRIHELFRKIP
ncbi:MAG: LCP family protein [Candidatus Moraniibacteriota bacterium]|nr:MAG: LCP family protein [Candidatus Moranbacteria bacterium]